MIDVLVSALPRHPPTDEEEIRVNGLSLVLYDFYYVPTIDVSKREAFGIKPLEIPNHYDVLFDFSDDERRDHAILPFPIPLEVPPLELPTAGLVRGGARLSFQLVNAEFVLATTVLNFDRSGKVITGPHLTGELPLRTDDILVLINELNQPEGSIFPILAEQRTRAVTAAFGAPIPLPDAIQNRRNVAIQIWDIGNLQLAPDAQINGIELAARYGWELSALLECNSDWWRVHRAWKDRRPDQVEPLLKQGSDVLADHRVLINRSVCLEISQVAYPTLKVRSAQRLAFFGYDSTSIYLWSFLTLADFVIGYYSNHLSRLLAKAQKLISAAMIEDGPDHNGISMSRPLLQLVVDAKVSIYHALDLVWWIPDNMKEQRHATFFIESGKARGTDIALSEVQRKLLELTSIATDVNQSIATIEQRDIMADLRTLNRSTIQTRRSIEFLNFVVTASAVSALSSVIGEVIPQLHTPWATGLTGLALFVAVIVIYLIISRRPDHAR